MTDMDVANTRTGPKVRTLLACLTSLVVSLGGGPSWAAATASPWGANYFPNVVLTTQDGNKVRFYDDLVKGKTFAINFIYTQCKDSCPLETAALRRVQRALGEHMGRDVFFYSISIDGRRDKPETLKAYAEKFHVGPGWTFLSGSKQDVTLLRRKLGLYRNDGRQEQELKEHSSNLLLGNEAGNQWIKRSPFEETQALVHILDTRLQSPTTPAGQPARATVVDRLPRPASPGEQVFQSHCLACHSTGSDDGIGPGLAGVLQKRDRGWLKRWIKEPDKLLAKKDPLALTLFKQYRQIYMPNLRLSDREVDQVIDYLDATQATAEHGTLPKASPTALR